MKPNASSTTRGSSEGAPATATIWQQPHLVFEVAEHPYACPITSIQQLLCAADARVSGRETDVPAWEIGRLTLQDAASGIPVVSLRALWGLPALQLLNRQREALLVVQVHDQRVALLVDACVCVLSSLPAAATGFVVPAALKGERGGGLGVAVPWRQSLLVTLELQELFQTKRPKNSLTHERHPS